MNEDFEIQLKLQKEAEEAEGAGEKSYIDSKDGTEYEWDNEKRAWFPKIDQEFLANYLSNYGTTPSSTEKDATDAAPEKDDNSDKKLASEQSSGSNEPNKQAVKRKANESEGWFEVEDQHNTNVYVSGLPLDTTEEEFIELMSKCGIITKDQDARKLKIKLYCDSEGNLKGDGRCCYIKIESVELALSILDGSELRGHTIHVERAKFQLRGAFDPKKKPKKKRNRDKLKQKKFQEKLFDWRPDLPLGARMKHESTVILKNMFDIAEFDKDAKIILEYQTDLREECAKFGEVKKVKVYDRHPENIAAITFKEPEEADSCIAVMNGRWFGGRQLTAETWDGKTKYTIYETEEQLEARMKKWDDYLEQEDNNT